MKNNKSTVILALYTILIGALLIAFPTNATRWLVIAIGALFLVPGIVTVATYIIQRRKDEKTRSHEAAKPDAKHQTSNLKPPTFPFIGIGSILFGSVLLIIPSSFLNALLYLLGTFLTLAGLAQIYRFLKLRKQYHLGSTPYIVSSLVTIAGIVIIILNYNTAANEAGQNSTTSYIFGVASIIFGLTEIIYAIQFRKDRKEAPSAPQKVGDADTAEETAEEESIAESTPQTAPEPAPQPVAEPTKQSSVAAPAPQTPNNHPQTHVETTTEAISYTSTQTFNTPSSPAIEAEVDGEV